MITPAWYARLFNGYGEPVEHVDNVVESIRSVNSEVRILVGPVRPWIDDQDGAIVYTRNAPWLNYMNTVVAYIAESATAKAEAGSPLAGPDGFALQVPGRPEALEALELTGSDEPVTDLPNPTWGGAQQGFRIYTDWLDVINSRPQTRGLPVYISATNTFAPDASIPPAQNYPQGWLTTALDVINREPQIRTLCWFLDLVPGDDRWDAFSLSRRPGRMVYAAEEFDLLLRRGLEE